jgi:hypothetical protein
MSCFGVAMKRAVILCAVGCNQFFGIDSTELAQPVDTDTDGVADGIDNCLLVANSLQHDEDGDSIGDVCDNCPLIVNALGEDLGDHDGVGDHCDPRPTSPGDCLILFDSFHDSTTFADHWTILSAESTPDVQPVDDRVTMTPDPLRGGIAIAARDLVGVFDVEATGRSAVSPAGFLSAASNLTTALDGYRCSVHHATNYSIFVGCTDKQCAGNEKQLLGDPIRDTFVIRVFATVETATNLACQIEYGIQSAGRAVSVASVLGAGRPGLATSLDAVQLDAIAIYQSRPGAPCPEPIIR